MRRRAALAVGRVGLPEAVEPLDAACSPTRSPRCGRWRRSRSASSAIRSARRAADEALTDADPLVQGRAAEALGSIGDTADAAAVGAMVQAHVTAGALTASRPTI